MGLFDRPEAQSGHDLERGDSLHDAIPVTLGLVLEEHLGPFDLVNLLRQVHVVLHHALGVLVGERLLAQLDHLHLVEAGLRAGHEGGASLQHRVVNALLQTRVQREVAHLFLQPVFHVFEPGSEPRPSGPSL